MSTRRRWQNVKGTQSRVTRPRERMVVALADFGARLVAPVLPRPRERSPRDVLVLRLDRIGDVLMSLPALHALRAALPDARIRLVVGAWSRGIARDAPVDDVLVWSAPWVGRADEGASTMSGLFNEARRLRAAPPDLAIDLQGDVRAVWLMAATGARARIGYANTGSGALLTHVVELDEDLNFVEQNRRAIDAAVGRTLPRAPFRWLEDSRRRAGRERLQAALSSAGLTPTGPVIGIHPGAGRPIKEWPVERFAELGKRLVAETGATLVLTGSAGERARTAAIHAASGGPSLDLAGQLDLGELAEVMSACDTFVSCDTAAMHFACAIDVPSVAIFGPSDPGRYFAGGPEGFGSIRPHVVLAPDLWCSPCNLIRRPPEECAALPSPECLSTLPVDRVLQAIRAILAPSH